MALATRMERVRTFLHAGDVGDLVYAAACMDLKRDRLYVTSKPWLTREPFDQKKFDFVRSLIPIRWWAGEKIDHDFTGFRDHYRPGVNLAVQQAGHVGLVAKPGPWLKVTPKSTTGILVARSNRYHHPEGDRFWAEVYRLDVAGFVGTMDEWARWCPESVPLLEFRTLRQMAETIAGCRCFIGNQSLPFALAAALGVRTILEPSVDWNDCRFGQPCYEGGDPSSVLNSLA